MTYARDQPFLIVSFLLAFALFGVQATVPSQAAGPPPDLVVFTRAGCPHCETAKGFLRRLSEERPALRIVVRDVGEDPKALRQLQELAVRHGLPTIGVPAFSLRDVFIVGYSDRIERQIWTLLEEGARSEREPDRVCAPEQVDCSQVPDVPVARPDSVEVPVLGRLSAQQLGLPLFTLAIGLLDGFNPCAMWVLLFLLSLLVNLDDRRKMAMIAGTFVIISGLVYFAFMAAWLNMFIWIGLSRITQVGLGAVAVVVGMINIKEFFSEGTGMSLAIPDRAKPRIYRHVREILAARNMAGALIGVVLLAFFVNLVELLCTAGFPAVYTHILAQHTLAPWQYYGYLGLYNAAYMLDDAVMVTIAVVTLGRRKLQEQQGRRLKLIGGVVMLGLGVLLIVRPAWLT